MIDDNDIGLRGTAARLEYEAAIEVRAAQARAEIRFGRHFVPHFARRRYRKVEKESSSRSDVVSEEAAETGAGRPGRLLRCSIFLAGEGLGS